MNIKEVMSELESLGTAQTVKTWRRHGADGDMFGVKVGDLKKVLKKIKGNQALAMELWETIIAMRCIWPPWWRTAVK
jgi:hypothetical protein